MILKNCRSRRSPTTTNSLLGVVGLIVGTANEADSVWLISLPSTRGRNQGGTRGTYTLADFARHVTGRLPSSLREAPRPLARCNGNPSPSTGCPSSCTTAFSAGARGTPEPREPMGIITHESSEPLKQALLVVRKPVCSARSSGLHAPRSRAARRGRRRPASTSQVPSRRLRGDGRTAIIGYPVVRSGDAISGARRRHIGGSSRPTRGEDH